MRRNSVLFFLFFFLFSESTWPNNDSRKSTSPFEDCHQFLSVLTGRTPVLINGHPVYIRDRSLLDPSKLNQHDLAYQWIVAELKRRGLKPLLQKSTVHSHSPQRPSPLRPSLFGGGRAEKVPDPREITNVIVPLFEADSLESVFNQEIILVGAHYDVVNSLFREWSEPSFALSPYKFTPGADDNGSGVTGLFALIDRFRVEPIRSNIVFVFFDGEEPGIYGPTVGSKILMKSLSEESRGKIKQTIIIDMIGKGSEKEPQKYSLSAGNLSRRRMVRLEESFGHPLGETTVKPVFYNSYDRRFLGMLTDSRHFLTQLIPTILICDILNLESLPSHYHTTRDSIDVIDWEYFFQIVDQVEKMIREIFDGEAE